MSTVVVFGAYRASSPERLRQQHPKLAWAAFSSYTIRDSGPATSVPLFIILRSPSCRTKMQVADAVSLLGDALRTLKAPLPVSNQALFYFAAWTADGSLVRTERADTQLFRLVAMRELGFRASRHEQHVCLRMRRDIAAIGERLDMLECLRTHTILHYHPSVNSAPGRGLRTSFSQHLTDFTPRSRTSTPSQATRRRWRHPIPRCERCAYSQRQPGTSLVHRTDRSRLTISTHQTTPPPRP